MSYTVSLGQNALTVDMTQSALQVSLSRTGGQGSQGTAGEDGNSVDVGTNATAYATDANNVGNVFYDTSNNTIYKVTAVSTLENLGSFGNFNVSQLGDVDVTGLADNYILQYNSGTSTWEVQPNTGGVGITNIVEDTTPQLGGTLDANLNNIDMGTNVITDPKVGQWDTAFSWGDHSGAGYLTDITGEALGNLSDVDLAGLTNGFILEYNSVSGNWEAVANTSTVAGLSDVTITSVASGEVLKWSGSAWVNNTLAEADIQAASNTVADARGAISVTDDGGDGSLAYNSTSGVITYTGPSAAEVRAHFSGGTGVDITSGVVSIGQAVGTSDNVTFNKVTTSLIEGGATITIDPTTIGDATGEVIIAGDLTVQGTTTSVNSNEVNIGDSIILLNSDETGTPSQNGGIEIERGTSANVQFVWNETDDAWDLANETLQNVVIDGGSY